MNFSSFVKYLLYYFLSCIKTYVTRNEDMSILFDLFKELSQTEWISKSIRDIRAFEMKNWSNFTRQVRNE